MKDQLIKVANELSDLAAHYEEKVTQKTWVTPGWVALLEQLDLYDGMELSFENDTDPTEVLHTVFLRLQAAESRRNKSAKYDWPVLRQDVQPAPAPHPERRVFADEAMLNLNPFWGQQLQQPNDGMLVAAPVVQEFMADFDEDGPDIDHP